MNANSLGCSQLCKYVIVLQFNFVVARSAAFCLVRETGTVSAFRIVRCTWIGTDLACHRHDEDITEVGMSCTAQVCMAEAHNRFVAMLISGTVLIDFALVTAVHIVGNSVRLGTELYDAKRYAGSRESVSHAIGAYNGIDIGERALRVKNERRKKNYRDKRSEVGS